MDISVFGLGTVAAITVLCYLAGTGRTPHQTVPDDIIPCKPQHTSSVYFPILHYL